MGTTEKSRYYAEHYEQMKRQPIEISQEIMTADMFQGLLLGNCIKYHRRAGLKEGESKQKDLIKRDRYAVWYYHSYVLEGKINPRLDYDMPKEKFIAFVEWLDTVCKE